MTEGEVRTNLCKNLGSLILDLAMPKVHVTIGTVNTVMSAVPMVKLKLVYVTDKKSCSIEQIFTPEQLATINDTKIVSDALLEMLARQSGVRKL